MITRGEFSTRRGPQCGSRVRITRLGLEMLDLRYIVRSAFEGGKHMCMSAGRRLGLNGCCVASGLLEVRHGPIAFGNGRTALRFGTYMANEPRGR